MDVFQESIDSILSDIIAANRALNAAALRLEDANKSLKGISPLVKHSERVYPPVDLDFADLYRNVLFMQMLVNQAVGFTKVGDSLKIDKLLIMLAIDRYEIIPQEYNEGE
ncbi:hypothetical protein [Chroococcidiopsis sp.]|uniref:hypothetical protein n=1 Tax=Chroococcidiopsis sp. TaxID=3088168 RepID=UPI003F356A76